MDWYVAHRPGLAGHRWRVERSKLAGIGMKAGARSDDTGGGLAQKYRICDLQPDRYEEASGLQGGAVRGLQCGNLWRTSLHDDISQNIELSLGFFLANIEQMEQTHPS